MANEQANGSASDSLQKALLYHFCRLRFPMMALSRECLDGHLQRCFDVYGTKRAKENVTVSWTEFVENLYTIDWFLCCACLEGSSDAWDNLFAARAYRSDCLLVDALRARAVRLFPYNVERQESAVNDFWGYLLVGEKEGSLPILARYDGQRPLVPWLIRVFQNRQISELRSGRDDQPLLEDDVESDNLTFPSEQANGRWHEEFRDAGRHWLATLSEQETLLLGLRHRYRLSQRQVASLLEVHEGNVSRQFTKLSDRFLDNVRAAMVEAGWMGEDLDDFIRKEMGSLLTDEPRLSADRLAALLSVRGKSVDDV